jgi:hypothetical protein
MKYYGLTSDTAQQLRQGGGDAFGNAAEAAISDGGGNPCRHCLQQIPKGAAYLILAHKPFATTQPYSEIGPIFICAGAITPVADVANYAAALLERTDVAFVDARSSKNNCWLARITRD